MFPETPGTEACETMHKYPNKHMNNLINNQQEAEDLLNVHKKQLWIFNNFPNLSSDPSLDDFFLLLDDNHIIFQVLHQVKA